MWWLSSILPIGIVWRIVAAGVVLVVSRYVHLCERTVRDYRYILLEVRERESFMGTVLKR